MKKDKKFVVQITTKGEVFGMEMFFPIYMSIKGYLHTEENPTFIGFIERIEKTLQRANKRITENKDGLLDANDSISHAQMWPTLESALVDMVDLKKKIK